MKHLYTSIITILLAQSTPYFFASEAKPVAMDTSEDLPSTDADSEEQEIADYQDSDEDDLAAELAKIPPLTFDQHIKKLVLCEIRAIKSPSPLPWQQERRSLKTRTPSPGFRAVRSKTSPSPSSFTKEYTDSKASYDRPVTTPTQHQASKYDRPLTTPTQHQASKYDRPVTTPTQRQASNRTLSNQLIIEQQQWRHRESRDRSPSNRPSVSPLRSPFMVSSHSNSPSSSPSSSSHSSSPSTSTNSPATTSFAASPGLDKKRKKPADYSEPSGLPPIHPTTIPKQNLIKPKAQKSPQKPQQHSHTRQELTQTTLRALDFSTTDTEPMNLSS